MHFQGFKDGRMVLNNLSADGDEGKTNVILKRIVDEVHAEDVKKEEEATTLGIGRFLFIYFLITSSPR